MSGTQTSSWPHPSSERETDPRAPATRQAVSADPPADRLTTNEAPVIAHRAAPGSAQGPTLQPCSLSRAASTEQEVSQLADIAVRNDLGRALAFVEQVCREGLSLEAVLVDLVPSAARLLEGQWKAAERTFTDVNAGLATLQQVVHSLGPSFGPTLRRTKQEAGRNGDEGQRRKLGEGSTAEAACEGPESR